MTFNVFPSDEMLHMNGCFAPCEYAVALNNVNISAVKTHDMRICVILRNSVFVI